MFAKVTHKAGHTSTHTLTTEAHAANFIARAFNRLARRVELTGYIQTRHGMSPWSQTFTLRRNGMDSTELLETRLHNTISAGMK